MVSQIYIIITRFDPDYVNQCSHKGKWQSGQGIGVRKLIKLNSQVVENITLVLIE